MPDYLTTSQAAAILNVTPARIRQLAQLRGVTRVGRDWLFTHADLDAMRIPGRPGPKPKEKKPITADYRCPTCAKPDHMAGLHMCPKCVCSRPGLAAKLWLEKHA